MTKYLNFFKRYFTDEQAAADFVNKCESLTQANVNHKSRIMMHQTYRLISIADDIPKLRPKREPLQLLFLMICVEHISKLHDGFTKEGQSKKYVRRFFNEFISQSDKNELAKSFMDLSFSPMAALSFEKVVDLLYDVRCDVVHEGKYWNFSFHDGQMPMINDEPVVEVCMTFNDLRDIVVKGCITAIKNKLKP